MQRVPLLFGTRLTVVDAPDDAVVLRPPPPGEPVADVRAAVRDALRFPLAGDPLEALVTRGGRATIVVEPPALPLPGALHDPRQDALAAASAELERAGSPTERQTLLVSTGLTRRPQQRELERLGIVSPGLPGASAAPSRSRTPRAPSSSSWNRPATRRWPSTARSSRRIW